MTDFSWKKESLASQGLPDEVEFEWRAPSNIALVKYWGKHGLQLPSNASLSMSLSQSYTLTSIRFRRKYGVGGEPDFTFRFGGEPKPSFEGKIRNYLERITPYSSWISDFTLQINSDNSFPHSSGIASSASSMAALSLCLMSMEESLTEDMDPLQFFDKASFLARLGSGSACRSLHGGFVSWGEHRDLDRSSDLFGSALDLPVADEFIALKDAILLVEEGSKSVSSTIGHGLMEDHPFAEQRFSIAERNLGDLLAILQSGDRDGFVRIVEGEALMLHALMMCSQPHYILMKPNTLAIIERVWEWRKETGTFCCFTLDAGANVHLIYNALDEAEVESFIQADLLRYCQNERVIFDRMGSGPKRVVRQNG